MTKYSDIVLKKGYFAKGSAPTDIDIAGALEGLTNLWNSPVSGPSRAKSTIMNLAKQGTEGESLLFAIRQLINRQLWTVRDAKLKAVHQGIATAISRFVRKK